MLRSGSASHGCTEPAGVTAGEASGGGSVLHAGSTKRHSLLSAQHPSHAGGYRASAGIPANGLAMPGQSF